VSAPETLASYRFLLRARVLGNLEWVCPCCGRMEVSKMIPSTYAVQCRHNACQRVWGVGHTLHELPRGRRQLPEDYLMPAGLEALPEGDAGRWWKSGLLMHCLHTASGSLAVPDVDEARVLADPRVVAEAKRRS
jgi:hypothetical protein